MKWMLFLLALFISTACYAKPPMNYEVYRDIGQTIVYSNCSVRGDSCNIVDPEKAKAKRNRMRNFIDQMRWIGSESESAALDGDAEAAQNIKKWFLDYESAPGLVYEFPTEGKTDREIEEVYQELHYVMYNIAMSYYKTKQFFSEEERKRVEAWLTKVINLNMYSKTSKYGYRTAGRNNHYFIIASSLAMTGVAINNKKFISDAKDIINESIDEMNYSGGWPLELKRKDKAGHYQMFMLNHMVAATMAIGIVDTAWAESRLKKFKKAELFTARLISDEAFFKSNTNAEKLDMSFDYNPEKRCTGQVWSWVTLSKNRAEIEAILQGKYRIAYEACNNDYLVGGNPERLIGVIFK